MNQGNSEDPHEQNGGRRHAQFDGDHANADQVCGLTTAPLITPAIQSKLALQIDQWIREALRRLGLRPAVFLAAAHSWLR